MLDIENKYIATADYNKFTKDNFANKIKSEELVDKPAIVGLINNADLNNKIATLATKAELEREQNKTKKLQTFNLSHFRGKNYFENDRAQNYFVFQSMYRYFNMIGSSHNVSPWKSKRSSYESINPSTTSDNSLAPSLSCVDTKATIKF